MKYQHLFTADAHCLRCSRCLRCLRCTGPYAWFRDKEPTEGVRVYDFCFCASLLFLHFCSPLFPLYRDPVTRRSPVIHGPCYTQALVHTDAFTHTHTHTLDKKWIVRAICWELNPEKQQSSPSIRYIKFQSRP